jgi:putative oxidoreductase
MLLSLFPVKGILPICYCFAIFNGPYFVSINSNTMKTFLKSLPAPLLMLLFVYAALSKLISFSEFRLQLGRQPLPAGVAGILLYLLPATELLTAALLLFPKTLFTGLQLSLCLLLLFTGYIALALLHYWDHIPCSCGGILNRLNWQQHFVFNLGCIGINLAGIRLYLSGIKSGPSAARN